jgi:hypothetical protein
VGNVRRREGYFAGEKLNTTRANKFTCGILLGLLLLAATAAVQAQFDYATNDGAITLAGYTGTGGAVVISNFVTSIGESAFEDCTALTSVAIPNSVTNIGAWAFFSCIGLTGITIPASTTSIGASAFENCGLTNVTIPGNVTSIGESEFEECFNLTNITISGNVTNIGADAFYHCVGLTNITIPAKVTSIGEAAFVECFNLTSIICQGNAPAAPVGNAFVADYDATVYYLPGSMGWSSPFDGRPAVLWNPLIQANGPNFGVQNNQFGFNITGTSNIPVVVEACTNLASPVWTPLQALTLTNGLFYFSEPFQPNSPERFYRVSSP